MATNVNPDTANPILTSGGSKRNSTRWLPAGTGTAISVTYARAIGAGAPSTVAVHPGYHTSDKMSKPACVIVTSTAICVGARRL